MNKKITFKIALAMGALLLVFVVMGTGVSSSVKSVSQKVEMVTDAYISVGEEWAELEKACGDLKNYTNLIAYLPVKDVVANIVKDSTASITKFDNSIEEIRRLINITEDKELLNKYENYVTQISLIKATLEEVISLYNSGNDGKIPDAAFKLNTYITSIDEAEAKFSDALFTSSETQVATVKKAISITRVFLNSCLVAFIIVIAGAIAYIVGTVIKPSKRANDELKTIISEIEDGNGDLTKKLTVTTKDEIGQLCVNINNFIETLRAIIKEIKMNSGEIMASADDIYKNIDLTNEGANDISSAMQELAASMEEVSATVTQIKENTDAVGKETQAMEEEVGENSAYVAEIKKRADKVKEETDKSKEDTDNMVESIRDQLEKAIEERKNAQKLDSLTGEILN
ncbi:MAG: methyl-accepting chemotaxis protein, partial [Lachnospiraceae bacterium]|nr:methyl-accepting chemotaxis protein [Lachnospiraceae bacterium]